MVELKLARLTAIITGEVQGVGYRAYARRHALDLDLAGHAENLSDGRVEVVAEGDRHDLEHFLVKLRTGPAHAMVMHIDIIWGESSCLEGFYVY
jgi:acylphosphatase